MSDLRRYQSILREALPGLDGEEWTLVWTLLKKIEWRQRA